MIYYSYYYLKNLIEFIVIIKSALKISYHIFKIQKFIYVDLQDMLGEEVCFLESVSL